MCVPVNFEEVEEITEVHKTTSERVYLMRNNPYGPFILSLQQSFFSPLLLKKLVFLSLIEIGILRKGDQQFMCHS